MVLLSAISLSHAEVAKKSSPEPKDEAKKETPPPAAVSTVSIEDLSGFENYPKQVQSLVQSALALTHLDLGYLYGSHEPAKGGMDCSGTVYHVLKFQGLKDVPRQSDEMCQWVEKKTQLHLTPTATAFDHTEFADLKPGDLLFWTNTAETNRKLPVTHVMIYLGKLKQSGKHVVFGASDGRSFAGQRRSGVSVFDFHLPKAEGTTRFHGYGAAPGLLPVETKPVIATTTPPAVEKPAPTPPPAAPPATAEKPVVTKEEVRKAVAIVPEAKPEPKSEPAKTIVAETKPKETPASTKPKTTTVKKSSPAPTTKAKKKSTPPPPPKSNIERTIDNAVNSVRRFFRQ
jgi:hypothetical protein